MRKLSIAFIAFIAVVVAACGPQFRGTMQTVTIGEQLIDDHLSLLLSLEVSAVLHEPLRPEPRPQLVIDKRSSTGVTLIGEDERWPHLHHFGIAASAAAGVMGQAAGSTGFASVGIDLLPVLSDNGAFYGLGAHVSYAGGEHAGVGVAPRIWFAAPVRNLVGGQFLVGLMLRCQATHDDRSFGCGPVAVLTRARF